jgi:hypothetical protein
LGVPLRVRQSLLAFLAVKKPQKSAQTSRSFLNANFKKLSRNIFEHPIKKSSLWEDLDGKF